LPVRLGRELEDHPAVRASVFRGSLERSRAVPVERPSSGRIAVLAVKAKQDGLLPLAAGFGRQLIYRAAACAATLFPATERRAIKIATSVEDEAAERVGAVAMQAGEVVEHEFFPSRLMDPQPRVVMSLMLQTASHAAVQLRRQLIDKARAGLFYRDGAEKIPAGIDYQADRRSSFANVKREKRGLFPGTTHQRKFIGRRCGLAKQISGRVEDNSAHRVAAVAAVGKAVDCALGPNVAEVRELEDLTVVKASSLFAGAVEVARVVENQAARGVSLR